jgi:hypothetical protein
MTIFNLKIKAKIKHKIDVKPIKGNKPNVIPKLKMSANCTGLKPYVNIKMSLVLNS